MLAPKRMIVCRSQQEEVPMARIPVQVKPAIWGAIGGAIAATIVGFTWGGWVTGGTSRDNAGVAAQSAVVTAFVPLCVAKAEQQSDQLAPLKAASSYNRYEFVMKAGWVAGVTEKYRRGVAEACATALVEAMDEAAKAPKKS